MADQIIPIIKQSQPVSTSVTAKPSQAVETISLPSKGYFYPETHPLASGVVDIYQVTARHEDILSNTNFLKKGIVLDEFLKAIIATPNVSLNDFLIGDKNALFIAARRSAYGDVYNTKVKCPECGVETQVSVDLGKLGIKDIDYSSLPKGANKLSFTLPVSGKTVVCSVLTHKNDADIDQEIKLLSKMVTGSTPPEVTTRLKYTIQSVDGDADRAKINKFVDEELTAKESLALRTFVREKTPDVDMTFDFVCPECGHQARMSIPLGTTFFWPSVSDK